MARELGNVWLIACVVLCCSAATACSDDDEGDGGRQRYVIDLDGADDDDMIGSLNDGQLGQICASFDAYVEAEINFEALSYVVCVPGAIVLSGGDERDCSRRLDECMALFPEPIQIQAGTGDVDVCIDELRDCNASIDGLEGCVNLNLGFIIDILENWSCGGASDERMRMAAEVMDTINVCADASASCGLGDLPAAPF